MSQQTTTITTAGLTTYNVPTTLLNGVVTATVDGAPGAAGANGSAGVGGAGANGGEVKGTISCTAGSTLSCYVGDQGTNGYHAGGSGAAGAGSSGGFGSGGHAGGSSAIVQSATLLIEAGGGGGGGGGTAQSGSLGAGGASSTGAQTPASGSNGGFISTNGQSAGGGGGGGGGYNAAGGPGGAPGAGTGGLGGTAPGGGGAGGTLSTNFMAGGGGGAGGKSFAAGAVSSVTFNDGASSSAFVTLVATVADAPLAPTLTAPANSSYLDANSAVTLQWTYNPGVNTGTQNAYALRMKLSGGSTYSYWNAGTSTWQSTIVWNSYTTTSVTLPTSAFSDGNTYNWSIATQESFYNLQGPFASDFSFVANSTPTVTITAPTGSIASLQPVVKWSTNDNFPQTQWQVRVFTQTVTQQGGFNPATSTLAVVDSGLTNGTAISYAIPTVLSNHVTYVVYVYVAVSTGQTNNWGQSSTFTPTADAPNTPTITASPGTLSSGAPFNTLSVQGYDNLLSAVDSSFESTSGVTWTFTNTQVAQQSALQANDGAFSWQLIAAAAGNITGTSGFYAIQPNFNLVGMLALFPGSTARVCNVTINWYTSGQVLISSTSGNVTEILNSWLYGNTQVVAMPSNAAYAKLSFTINSVAGPLATPAAPTITTVGTAGSTSYFYKIVYHTTFGIVTSSEGSIATGNATLNGTNYNLVKWTVVAGTTTVDIWRGTSSGNENIQVATGQPVGNGTTGVNDQGGGNAGSIPTTNTTGECHFIDTAGLYEYDGGNPWTNFGEPAPSLAIYGSGTAIGTVQQANGSAANSGVAVSTTQVITYSAYVDATNITAGNAYILLLDQNGNTLKSINATNGVAGTVTDTYTVASGVTSVRLALGLNANAVIANDTYAFFSSPNIQINGGANVCPDQNFQNTNFYWAPPSSWTIFAYTWSLGGFAGNQAAEIQYSYDGVTWTYVNPSGVLANQDVRNASALALSVQQQASVVDYEQPPLTAIYYRAILSLTVNGVSLSSGYSKSVKVAGPATTNWFIRDPLNPTVTAVAVSPVGQFTTSQQEQMSAFYAIGRQFPVISSDVVNGQDGTLNLVTFTTADYTNLKTILASQKVYLLQSPFGEQWYVRLQSGRQQSLQGNASTSAAGAQYRTTQVQYLQVDKP